jgi:hypothetical protein
VEKETWSRRDLEDVHETLWVAAFVPHPSPVHGSKSIVVQVDNTQQSRTYLP